MIRVFDDFDRLSEAAAELFAGQARRAVAARGRFCVALAGGSTPRRSYQLLSRAPFRETVPWSQVHVFWGDERCVPSDDPRSNEGRARAALLDKVPLPPGQIHPMACTRGPKSAALAFETLLLDFFAPEAPRFDLILLGLGTDGHTASLFPGSKATKETRHLVVPVQGPGEDFARLTLTVPVLNRARLVVFLVSGKDKAGMLRQILRGPAGSFPAQLIVPEEGDLRWLVDREAAGSE
jgi:6-phosphogluconolactonase